MIRLDSVNKYFGDVQVLKDITTTFEAGKTNLIIGQSGSGKTVLLKCIVGLHEISSGTIFYDDRKIDELSKQEKKSIRQEMGMVFQGGALFDSMTVEQNIHFPLDMFTKQSRAEKQKRVDFCLDRVNLDKANKFFPAEISGGMRKRVAIARALYKDPEILVLDEATSSLDEEVESEIMDEIYKLSKDRTLIIIAHKLSTIDRCEKVFEIKNGVITNNLLKRK